MAIPITTTQPKPQQKGPTSSRLVTSNPKKSPGREAFASKTRDQNASTVRSALRKDAGRKRA